MLSEELAKLHDVEIVLIGNREDKEGLPEKYREPYSGIDVIKCFNSGRPGFSEFVKCVEELKPDIVHIQHEHDPFPSMVEFLEAVKRLKELGVRVVVTLHTVTHALAGYEYVEFHRALAKLVDAIIVHSALQENELIAQGVPSEKIHVVPHGTALNPYKDVVSKRFVLEKLGLDPELANYVIISTPGFVRKDKGLDVLLKMFSIVKNKIDAKLVLFGEPQGDGYQLIRELERVRSNDVVFIRSFLPRHEMMLFLAGIDVAVFPYRDKHNIGVSGALHLAIGSRVKCVCTHASRLVECYTYAPTASTPRLDPEELAKRVVMAVEGVVDDEYKLLFDYGYRTRWQRIAEIHRKLYVEIIEK